MAQFSYSTMYLPDPNRLVYWANVEFAYLEGSKYFGEFEGGFVYAFVQAVDARDALEQFQLEFAGRKLGILLVESITVYAEVAWPTEEDQQHFDRIAVAAASSEEVVFDSFDVYERR